MTLQPLLQAPLLVQAHVATVLLAFVVGTWLLFFSRKGSRLHRTFGVLFITLMVSTAIIALFIHRRMPDSPIFGLSRTHLLIPVVLFAVWRALDGVFNDKIRQHRVWVSGLYFGALVTTGVVNAFEHYGITHAIFAGP
jgi:uncharacterized membrane protein